jgi:hypothetical protein
MSHKKYRSETNCLNCGGEVTGKFCPECGQQNIETHENFFHLAFHVVADFFHFDSKFFRTFIPLITKPGFLTNEYWKGRRSHYLHPLRLFFFITIVMVLVASAYYNKFRDQIVDNNKNVSFNTETKETDSQEKKEKAKKKMLEFREGVKKAFSEVTGYLKYISFLLLPMYALSFKLLYRKSKRFYVDHLVLMLHVQSFVYLVAIVALLVTIFITPLGREWWPPLLIGVTTIYIFFSSKRLFNQSIIKTLIKSLLAVGYMFFITITLLSLIILANTMHVIFS